MDMTLCLILKFSTDRISDLDRTLVNVGIQHLIL